MKSGSYLFLFFLIISSCSKITDANGSKNRVTLTNVQDTVVLKDPDSALSIVVGADRIEEFSENFTGKNIAVIVNQTSYTKDMHLVDAFIQHGFQIKAIFAPEHGFKGDGDAGEHMDNGFYGKDRIPIYSLYGEHKKPAPEQLKGIDLLVFDIQDVGARFYTYISTMHYAMEASAENKIPFMVLDRPNPLGMFIDGPILQPSFTSFVGMHPIPIVHGVTVGELAQMINGEKWMKNGVQCDLKVIECLNYTHKSTYSLPMKPSPNLPNDLSIRLYPSLCLFEGTKVSVGRGTHRPFQQVGYPGFKSTGYTFTPVSIPGMSKYPKFENQICNGYQLDSNSVQFAFDVRFLIEFYKEYSGKSKDTFFQADFFDKLAGSSTLRQQIIAGNTEKEIRNSWEQGLKDYRLIRKKYLLYPDFE